MAAWGLIWLMWYRLGLILLSQQLTAHGVVICLIAAIPGMIAGAEVGAYCRTANDGAEYE